jgi:hypothetical protein
MMYDKEISVLIGTCDAYSSLWKYFDAMFSRNWKIESRNYLIGENIGIYNSRYIDVLPGKSFSWTERILSAANRVETPFIFFVLDDYLLTQEITSEIIHHHISNMIEHGINKVVMAPNSPYYNLQNSDVKEYMRFSKNSSYLNTVQPAIWSTDFFIECMSIGKFNPWEFEVEGSKLLSKTHHNICITCQDPIYYNAVRKGFNFNPDWLEFKLAHKLDVN